MISINRSQVDTLSKQQNSKQLQGKSNATLYSIFAHAKTNTEDYLKDSSLYEMAHWTNFSDRWISNKTSKINTIGYHRGTILFVDLGANNFGHEPSFTHPAIVLNQSRDSLLIVPCSSKKYRKGFPEIVDATPEDGFSTNTGIQTNSLRWISKNRVISSIGLTNSTILNQIDNLLLKSIPLHKQIIFDNENRIHILMQEKKELEAENQYLKSQLEELQMSLKGSSFKHAVVDSGTNLC